MLRPLLCAVAVLACSGAVESPAPLLSITEVKARHEQLDRQIVRIRGWITGCMPVGCLLADEATEQPWLNGGHGWITLDSSREMKRTLLRHRGRVAWKVYNGRLPTTYTRGHFLFVEIEGTVDRTCFNHEKEGVPLTYICAHAAREIVGTRLVKVIKTGPAPKSGR